MGSFTTENSETEKNIYMLRDMEGTPLVTFVHPIDGTNGWERDPITGARKETGNKKVGKTPFFDEPLPSGSIIELTDEDGKKVYAEVKVPKRNPLRNPTPSVFVERIFDLVSVQEKKSSGAQFYSSDLFVK